MRTINKVGGLDQYVLGDKTARIKELGVKGWELRWRVLNAMKKRGILPEQKDQAFDWKSKSTGLVVAAPKERPLSKRILKLRAGKMGLAIEEGGKRLAIEEGEKRLTIEEGEKTLAIEGPGISGGDDLDVRSEKADHELKHEHTEILANEEKEKILEVEAPKISGGEKVDVKTEKVDVKTQEVDEKTQKVEMGERKPEVKKRERKAKI